ncbi:hypothetical protein P8452_15454 [Trifolium repens]|nr:NDR1/HIN1 protein [Trifolium repens]WJX26545.1 hypothetical protein P8452_15454 [Trifolium repens]
MAMNYKPSFESISLILFLSSMIFLAVIITFSPSNAKIHITHEATLTKINLASHNTLYYQFEANITSKNPIKNVEDQCYRRRITTIAWCKHSDFAMVSLVSFRPSYSNTTFLNIVFDGMKNVTKRLKPKRFADDNEAFGLFWEL